MYSTEEKLRHLFRKVCAMPEDRHTLAIRALAEIADDFYLNDAPERVEA